MKKEYFQSKIEQKEHYFQPKLNLNVSVHIPDDDMVYLVEKIVQNMDLSILKSNKQSNVGRKEKISKERLLMILIYAYIEGIYSSREIAKKLRRDINYMYLAEEIKISHNKINKFRKYLKDDVFLNIFKQFTLMLYNMKEIKFDTVYIDGTKIEANANKYTFVWKKTIQKYEVKLQKNVKVLIESINNNPKLGLRYMIKEDEKVTIEIMSQIINDLKHYATKYNIIFVEGKGNKKSEIQKYIEKFENYLMRQSEYDHANSIFGDRNSYSKVDNDATFMRMKEDSMKNGQLKPGYNVQVAVDGEYAIGVGIFNHRNDIDTLIPLVKSMKDLYKEEFKKIVCDSGYFSEKNIYYLSRNNIKFYIPYQSYYLEQTSKFKKNIGKKENMTYIAERDVYICANNQELRFVGITNDYSDPEYTVVKRKYQCQNCKSCPLKNQCMPSSKKEHTNKTIIYSNRYERQKKQALKNIKSEDGIKYRINRSIQVEGFFGILKEDYNFRRFLLRGAQNVYLEMLLLAFAHNVRKLHTKLLKNKIGIVTFHEVKAV